jgi:hypothetical protein
MTTKYLPNHSNKLDVILNDSPELSSESLQKVRTIKEIARVANILSPGIRKMTVEEFDNLYDSPLSVIERHLFELEANLESKRSYES